MRLRLLLLMLVLYLVSATQVNAVEDHDEESFSFVIFGHVYGKSGEVMSFHFEEIKSEIEKLQLPFNSRLVGEQLPVEAWKHGTLATEVLRLPGSRHPSHRVHSAVARLVVDLRGQKPN